MKGYVSLKICGNGARSSQDYWIGFIYCIAVIIDSWMYWSKKAFGGSAT